MSRFSGFLPHVTHEIVGDAFDILLPVAKRDTDQSVRTANFLLSWWNGSVNGHIDIVGITAVDRELGDAMAIIILYLAKSDTAYADQWGRNHNIQELIDQWRPAYISKRCFCCVVDQNMKLGDIIC
jgi:hypothetical protein